VTRKPSGGGGGGGGGGGDGAETANIITRSDRLITPSHPRDALSLLLPLPSFPPLQRTKTIALTIGRCNLREGHSRKKREYGASS